MNRSLADVICIDFNDVQGAIRTNTTPGVGRVWATVLAIAFIDLYGLSLTPPPLLQVSNPLTQGRLREGPQRAQCSARCDAPCAEVAD